MVPANRDHIRERSRLDFAPGVLAICAGQVKDTHHFLDGTDPVCSLDAPRVSSASILGSEWMDRHSIESFGVGARFHFGLSKTELGRRRARLPASPPAEKANARQDQSRQSSADDGAGDRSQFASDLTTAEIHGVDVKIGQSAFDSRDQRCLGPRDRPAIGCDKGQIVEARVQETKGLIICARGYSQRELGIGP